MELYPGLDGKGSSGNQGEARDGVAVALLIEELGAFERLKIFFSTIRHSRYTFGDWLQV